jgi:hypothetical protein
MSVIKIGVETLPRPTKWSNTCFFYGLEDMFCVTPEPSKHFAEQKCLTSVGIIRNVGDGTIEILIPERFVEAYLMKHPEGSAHLFSFQLPKTDEDVIAVMYPSLETKEK